MATKYLDLSLGTGANDGSSWANAWQSLSAMASGVSAGDLVLVSHTSSTISSGNVTVDLAAATANAPIVLRSTDKTDDSYARGASVGTTGGYYHLYLRANKGRGIFEGFDFSWSGQHYLCADIGDHLQFRDCKWTPSTNASYCVILEGSVGPQVVDIEDCEIDFTNQTAGRTIWQFDGRARIKGLTISNATYTASTPFANLTPQYQQGQLCIEDADLSSWDELFSLDGNYGSELLGRQLKLRSGVNVITQNPATLFSSATLLNCSDGSLTAPSPGLYLYENALGTVKFDSTRYRDTDGASDDGSRQYSLEMVTNSGGVDGYASLVSPVPLQTWITPGVSPQTLTVYIAGAADLDTDECWIEVSSPDEGATAYAAGNRQTTRSTASGTAITRASTVSWTGSGTGTDGSTGQQKLSVTLDPTIAGPVTVWVHLAKPSTTLYVDPNLELS